MCGKMLPKHSNATSWGRKKPAFSEGQTTMGCSQHKGRGMERKTRATRQGPQVLLRGQLETIQGFKAEERPCLIYISKRLLSCLTFEMIFEICLESTGRI